MPDDVSRRCVLGSELTYLRGSTPCIELTASPINARARAAVGSTVTRAIRAHAGIYPKVGNGQLYGDGDATSGARQAMITLSRRRKVP